MKNLDESRRTEPDTTSVPVEVRKAPTDSQESSPHLIPQQQCDELRSRWTAIQTSFIDEPRRAVKDADALVLAATKHLSDAFTQQRSQLEKQWSRGDEVSTEDLRIALQQYRSFFSRLLSI
jgi:hypothetical protein